MPPVVACQYYLYMKIKLRIVFDWQMEQMENMQTNVLDFKVHPFISYERVQMG